ncbi:interferon regulatory factor 9 [Pseudophryne corroboree]|uniref:interferon regulatory factor 9 n=1 Tax=Pseudophryne corroboree TaxID=495146 RepID=UPI00308200D0
MASRRARPTRKLKPWLVEQIESGKFGLKWEDEQKNSFRIPWKHAGKQDFRHDEDAAVFKAWAVYKNKYKNGEKVDAAAWKTRLRCALNKSPEFQERPEKSRLDICEPFKVYRIVPPEEQVIAPIERTGRKRKGTADSRSSSSDEVDQVERKSQIKLEDDISEVTSSISPEDSGIGSDTSNTDIPNFNQNNPNYESSSPNTHIVALNPPAQPSNITHTDLKVTVIYSGVEVSQCMISSGDCKLSARVPERLAGGMEHVLLPAPDDRLVEDIRKHTEDLLKFLEAGVMLASTPKGIFAQRQKSCRGRIFWTSSCLDNEESINKLERDKHVQLFDTNKFLRALEIYRTEGGTPPNSHVTLCFGEEISDFHSANDKLITAKIEQVMASELVRQATENHLAQSREPLQDPPAPFLIPLLPVDMSTADLCD